MLYSWQIFEILFSYVAIMFAKRANLLLFIDVSFRHYGFELLTVF